MKPKEIAGLITRRMEAAKMNVKGFIGASGITFKTFRNLQTGDGSNSNMNSIAACLRLMDLAEVAHPERYLELDLPGEQVVAIRRADFLALVDGAVAEAFEKEKREAADKPTKSAGRKIKNKAGEIARAGKKQSRKGKRGNPQSGRWSRGRSNRSGRSGKGVVRWDLVPFEEAEG